MGTSTPVCTVVSSVWRTSRWTRTEDVNTCLYRDQFHLEDVDVAEVIETYVPENSGSSRATKLPGTFVVDSESNGNVAHYIVDVSLPGRRRFVC